MFCPNCGKKNADDSKFCEGCGSVLTEQTSAAPPPPQPKQPLQQPVYNPQPSNPEGYLKKPLTVGDYIVMFILFCIPFVNIILLLVWAFGSNVNENKKNYCRAILILALIGIVLGILFGAVFAGVWSQLYNTLSTY